MTRALTVTTLALCLFAVSSAAEAKKKASVEEARALIAAAASTWDRRAVSGEPVAFRASVAVRLQGRKPLDGTWSFEHVGGGRFREVLDLPGFREVLVANDDGWWLSRSSKRYLQLVADIQDALEPARHLELGEQRSITAVKSGKSGGRRVLTPRIVEQDGTPPAPFQVSVDAITGAPVRYECRLSHTSYDYEGEIAIGDVRIPKRVLVRHGSWVVVTIDLEQVRVRPNSEVLAPPANAVPAVPETAPRCEKFRAPVATLSPRMRYPGQAALANAAGQVRGRLLIDQEGRITRQHVSWASDAMFAESALEALEGRQYRPGRCGGEPVRVLSETTFWFGGKIR